MRASDCAVAIPARNEAERIGECLAALAAQAGAPQGQAAPGHVVVLVNNSDDATADIARAVPFPPSTRLHVIEATLPAAQANPGHARRLAMEHALGLVSPWGALLTTDADGLVDADWMAATLACFEAGADAVAGWVELHPADWSRIPTRLHEDDARECAYDALCDAIEAALDPDSWDPLPRHTQNSGASLAITVRAYRDCGGVPALPCGEDRALVAALRRIDARIRHAPEVHAHVSGRIDGRAPGGMAETIRRRLSAPDEFIDDRLEPAAACARRAGLRAELRALHAGGAAAPDLAARLALAPSQLAAHLRGNRFGQAWAGIEADAPVLRRVRVPAAALAAQTAAATAILDALRGAAAGALAGRAARVVQGTG